MPTTRERRRISLCSRSCMFVEEILRELNFARRVELQGILESFPGGLNRFREEPGELLGEEGSQLQRRVFIRLVPDLLQLFGHQSFVLVSHIAQDVPQEMNSAPLPGRAQKALGNRCFQARMGIGDYKPYLLQSTLLQAPEDQRVGLLGLLAHRLYRQDFPYAQTIYARDDQHRHAHHTAVHTGLLVQRIDPGHRIHLLQRSAPEGFHLLIQPLVDLRDLAFEKFSGSGLIYCLDVITVSVWEKARIDSARGYSRKVGMLPKVAE